MVTAMVETVFFAERIQIGHTHLEDMFATAVTRDIVNKGKPYIIILYSTETEVLLCTEYKKFRGKK